MNVKKVSVRDRTEQSQKKYHMKISPESQSCIFVEYKKTLPNERFESVNHECNICNDMFGSLANLQKHTRFPCSKTFIL